MRHLRLMLVSVVVLAVGCMGVKPETEAKIQELNAKITGLDAEIAALEKAHAAGELSTKDFIAKVTPMFKELLSLRTDLSETWKKAEEEGSNKWGVGALIGLNVLAIIAGRVLGIPGLASSSGANLFNLGKQLLARSANGGTGNGGG